MRTISRSLQGLSSLSQVLLLILGLGAQPLLAGTYHQIEVPNSTQTSVEGINNLNQVVGWYFDQKGNSNGFLLSNGKYTPVNFGIGNENVANGISDSGVIVGFYQSPPPQLGPPHGWIDQNGSFTEIDYPGAVATYPEAINNSGVVVGFWQDGLGNSHAFRYVNGTFSPINIPNAVWSFAYGIDKSGDISGTYWISMNGGMEDYGFILGSNGKLQTIQNSSPNAAGTLAGSLNNKLQVAGYYDISNTSDFSGFVFAGGKFYSVNYPNAISTTPAAINDADIVVGTWYPTGPEQNIPHGFYFVP